MWVCVLKFFSENVYLRSRDYLASLYSRFTFSTLNYACFISIVFIKVGQRLLLHTVLQFILLYMLLMLIIRHFYKKLWLFPLRFYVWLAFMSHVIFWMSEVLSQPCTRESTLTNLQYTCQTELDDLWTLDFRATVCF